MISVSNKKLQKVFLTSKTKNIALGKKIDIILSPEFYWVRKFEIPVKTQAQARHVLPTLFEDIVDDITILRYQVIKLEENQFLCFAYNNKKIYEQIKKLNIPISSIKALYFGQNECMNFNTFNIDDLKFMYTSDGILVKIPNGLTSESIDLSKVINTIKLSSHKVEIKLYNDVLNTKYYYSLFIILGVLLFVNVIKYYDYSKNITKLNRTIEEVKKTNKLPSSMIQTSVILKKYEKEIKKENKKREAIQYILSNSKLDLKNLKIENNIFELEYLLVEKEKVNKYLSKKYKVISKKENGSVFKIRIEL